MTFEECFRFYSSYIKDITQLSKSVIYNAKQSFQDKILGYEGLPVILVKKLAIEDFSSWLKIVLMMQFVMVYKI